MLLSPGERLNEDYGVTRLLGRGSMGEVWEGHGPGGAVAIKVMLEHASRRKEMRRRFEREARMASQIRSQYVRRLLDQGVASDGTMFLVFELLQGESLADRLAREGFLSFREAAPLMSDVLRGIQDAHRAGVLHRDLKPANIFLQQEEGGERAKIVDFGVGKKVKDRNTQTGPTLTTDTATVGSVAYMAPEQVRGAARVDERADLYGMASVAFRALAGRLPFDGVGAQVMARFKLQQAPLTLEQATGFRWPRLLEEFFRMGLARLPEDRFGSAVDAAVRWREVWDVVERGRLVGTGG